MIAGNGTLFRGSNGGKNRAQMVSKAALSYVRSTTM